MTDKPTYEELERRLGELLKETEAYRETNNNLRAERDRYKAIFDNIKNGVAIYRAIDGGTDFVFEDANPAAERINKISKNDLMGKRVRDVFPGVREFGLFDVFQKVCRTGQPEHHDIAFHKDEMISGWRENVVFKLPSGEIVAVYSDETKRRQNEKYLTYFEKAVDAATDAIGMCTPEGRHWYQNQAMADLLDVVGSDPPASVYEDERVGREVFETIMAGGHWQGEVAMKGRGGKSLQVFLRAYAIKDDDDKIIGLVGVHTDVTEQKRTEKELREARRLLETVMEQSPIPMAIATPDGSLAMFNDACREQLMIEAIDDVQIGSSLFDMQPTWKDYDSDGNFVPSSQLPLALALQGKKTNNLELRVVRKDGSERWEIVSGTPIYDDDGDLVAGFVAFPDITALKQAEKALQKEMAFTEFALNAQTDTFFVFNPLSGQAIRWNKAFREISGYDDAQIRSLKAPDSYYSPEDLEKAGSTIAQVLSGGKATVTISLITKDGRRIPMEYSVSGLEVTGKDGPYMVSIGREITERIRAEEELRANQERLSLALDIGNAGIWEMDTRKNELRLDDRFRAMLGYTPACFLPKSVDKWEAHHHPDEFGEMMEKMTAHLTGKTPIYESEHRIKSKQGDWVWVFTRGKIVQRDEKGDPKLLVGIAMDVTERKLAEKALRASEEKYGLLYSAMSEGVCVHDIICDETGKPVDYLITDVNPAYESITGLARDRAIGTPASKIYGTGLPPYLDVYADVADSGIPTAFEAYFPPMDKHFTISVFCPQKGKFATIFTDTTDRKKLESQLRQSQKMEAIGTLAGGIAHDFNNILGIILGNTELAMDDVPDWNPARQNLETVREASVRARDVIRQLLSFSRKTESNREPVTLSHIVRETMKLLRSSIPKSIVIQTDIPAQTHTILADPAQIHQVLINLCANAAHAMEENGGVLQVRLKNVALDEKQTSHYPDAGPGNYVWLSISDTGHGIPSEIRDRIFDPYFTTKEVHKGTGMGLAVVHGIVKNHGGTVSVYSEPGKGTHFKILFPAVEGQIETETKKSTPLPMGNEKILLVDDEPELVKMTQQILIRLGYAVETHANPLDALESFRSNPDRFDLVITDMIMPHMTGDRLAHEIKSIRPELPIILCTGFSEKIDEEKAAEMGIDKYMEKPLYKNDISLAIREILNGE